MHANSMKTQNGVALIVALVLLLIMTMIAVIAMRSTTLDLKMTTNTTLSRRAFQNSEGPRVSLGPALESHVFYRGWPIALNGTVNEAIAVFNIPDEVSLNVNPPPRIYRGENGDINDLFDNAAGLRRTPLRAADARFHADADPGNSGEDADDMTADLWATWLAVLPAAGSGTAQAAGYLSIGVGSAGAGAHVYFDVRSDGQTVGNANATTGADYRVLVRN